MDVIDEAIKLNHALVHQPFAKTNLKVKLRYDLLDYWHKVRSGEQALLREQPMVVEIDRTVQALRRLPEVVPRDRLVGQQEGRLSLCAQRRRHHAGTRRPLLISSMKYRALGRTGLSVSEIGFGAWGIGGRTVGTTSYGDTDDRTSLAALGARLRRRHHLFRYLGGLRQRPQRGTDRPGLQGA